MKTMTRFRLVFVLGLMATVFLAFGPQQVSAASGRPHVTTGYWISAERCWDTDGEHYCKTGDDGYGWKVLNIQGSHFTPRHAVDVWLFVVDTKEVLFNTTVYATSSGTFGLRTDNVYLCAGGRHLQTLAIDSATGFPSNIANAFECPD
jgi:hypothetical protein